MRSTIDTYCCLTVFLLLFGAAGAGYAEGARTCRSMGQPDACRGCEGYPSALTGLQTAGSAAPSAARPTTCCCVADAAAQPVDSILPDNSPPQHAARSVDPAALFPSHAAGEVLPVQGPSFASSSVPLHILYGVILT